MHLWRDVDSERKRIGVTLWTAGGEVHCGRRLYRWRYRRFGRPVAAASPVSEQREGQG